MHGYYGAEVSGSTIGIVGMGKIGYAVARRANGFGMKVIYHNRKRRETDEKQFGEKHIYYIIFFSVRVILFLFSLHLN